MYRCCSRVSGEHFKEVPRGTIKANLGTNEGLSEQNSKTHFFTIFQHIFHLPVGLVNLSSVPAFTRSKSPGRLRRVLTLFARFWDGGVDGCGSVSTDFFFLLISPGMSESINQEISE